MLSTPAFVTAILSAFSLMLIFLIFVEVNMKENVSRTESAIIVFDVHVHVLKAGHPGSCSHVVFCGVLSVLCSCVLFLCVSEVEVVIPFCSFLYISLWLVCYTQ